MSRLVRGRPRSGLGRAARSLPLACLALGGCAPDPPPYQAVVDVKQLMHAVVEPSAEAYWDAVGTVVDLEGTHDFAPSTDAEWETVRNAAVVMAESGNLLLMPGRAREGELWVELTQQMVARSRDALAAAEARDPAAVFEAGGEVYGVCNACHAAYAPQSQRFHTESGGEEPE